MSRKKRIALISLSVLLFIYVFILPLPTAELAVRRNIFISLHPIKAFHVEVTTKGSTSFGGAVLYNVSEVSRSFIWVKKSWLGYRVIADGTGP
ncbi:hypothetical protein D3C85_1621270 [compost metagenome]